MLGVICTKKSTHIRVNFTHSPLVLEPNFNVFRGKKTKIVKIHVRFSKIQFGVHETDFLSKSELKTPSELRVKFEKLKSIFFFIEKKIDLVKNMILPFKVQNFQIFLLDTNFSRFPKILDRLLLTFFATKIAVFPCKTLKKCYFFRRASRANFSKLLTF